MSGPRQGVRPPRRHHQHRAVRPAHRTGDDLPALHLGPPGVLGGRQRFHRGQASIDLDFLFGTEDVQPAAAPHTAEDSRWGLTSGPAGAGILQRAGDRSSIDLSTGVRWERLTPTYDGKVDFIEIVYEPGGQSSEDGRALRHDGREYLYVLEGELEAVVGFEKLLLAQGDSMAFDPATPHHYRNPTNGIVRALSVVVHGPTG
ncbi:MAG: cupin domain-containing protein [Mycobacterium sp.]